MKRRTKQFVTACLIVAAVTGTGLPWHTGQGYACTVEAKRRTGKEI